MGKRVEVLRAIRPMHVVSPMHAVYGQLLSSSKKGEARVTLLNYYETEFQVGARVFFEVVLGTRSKKRSHMDFDIYQELTLGVRSFCKEGVRHIMGVKNYKRLLQAAKNKEYAIIRVKKA